MADRTTGDDPSGMICPSCGGRGWHDAGGRPVRCGVCDGTGKTWSLTLPELGSSPEREREHPVPAHRSWTLAEWALRRRAERLRQVVLRLQDEHVDRADASREPGETPYTDDEKGWIAGEVLDQYELFPEDVVDDLIPPPGVAAGHAEDW